MNRQKSANEYVNQFFSCPRSIIKKTGTVNGSPGHKNISFAKWIFWLK